MKADRTVIVFGVFLFLIGLSVAWNGYSYIQLERGWSMVIAGTVGFCSGLILVALGLILRQLEIVSASAAQSALFLAKVKSDAVPAAALAAGAAVSYLAPEPEAVAPAPAEPEPAPEQWAPRAAESVASFVEPAPLQETPVSPFAAAPAQPFATPAPAVESYTAKPPAWMSRAGAYVSSFAAARTPSPAPEPPPEPTAPDDLGLTDEQADWLEKAVAEEVAAVEAFEAAPVAETAPAEPLFHAESAHEPLEHAPVEPAPFEVEPEPQPEPHAAQEGGQETSEESWPETLQATTWQATTWQETTWRETRHEAEAQPEPDFHRLPEPEPEVGPEPEPELEAAPEPVLEREPEPEPEEAAEPAPTPAIMGQYEAHGARYTLYVDGSIDAETAHGTYRFASMEELKRFIEKGA
ncbi:MAG TPA: hypothetical protein VMU18_02085 [Rhodoblastus sp.]|nr:hypothetical protein [Rhodoblastus sp.]